MVGAPLGGAAPLGHDDRMAGRRVTLGRETDAPQLGREPLGAPRDVAAVLGLGADARNREELVQSREAGRLVAREPLERIAIRPGAAVGLVVGHAHAAPKETVRPAPLERARS